MDNHLASILNIVRTMPPTGKAGFEGLVGRALESVVGVPFRLSSSGFQRGLDGRSVGEGAVVFEAKRYGDNIHRESVLTKLLDGHNNGEEADCPPLAALLAMAESAVVAFFSKATALAWMCLPWSQLWRM